MGKNTHGYYPGQRWLSETETELGVGTILELRQRVVRVLYRAVMETRDYAIHSAPLVRVRFESGDEITDSEGNRIVVTGIYEDPNGVLTYTGRNASGQQVEFSEINLDHRLPVQDPASRLLAGHVDDDRWFTLRYLARDHEGTIWQSPVRGLQGARITLVPHQLFIADRVARQPRARALLADEVGLGKTIEACLILHRRVIQEQCQRALVIVPPSLVNQWLVELLRRFNLSFSVYDEQRCLDIEEAGPEGNPFLHAQFVLVPLTLFENHRRIEQALDAGWDMLIVDEAHHLHWSPGSAGEDYQVVEMLATRTESLLLLTATPEQLGRESHFARLRLLDPDRFTTLEQFIAEENEFEPVANLAEAIMDKSRSDSELCQALQPYGIDISEQALVERRTVVARQLVDLHGTSRLMYRNTRAFIEGFPERRLVEYPLGASQAPDAGFDEAIYDRLLENDPRIDWLTATIRELRPAKLLLICSKSETAIALTGLLQKKEGIRCAAFHEELSIIQRDRAAAWFAEDNGAEILLCSEIGSEGRNFQFVKHLLLFDLPLNPDLMEQRIGRLDRIGQKHEIQIHLPYIENSPQESLFRWYRDVTELFSRPDPVAGRLYETSQAAWREALEIRNPEQTSRLIDRHRQQADSMRQAMGKGRDRLLALASYDKVAAQDIVAAIDAMDHDQRLQPFLEMAFDIFGLDSEVHSDSRQLIQPGDHMMVGHFPGVDNDGTLATFNRETALVHEDTEFLTWDHPMVIGAIDLATSGEFGNCALSVIAHERLTEGASLLELIYRIDVPAPAHLQVYRFVEQPVVRLLLDSEGREMAEQLPHHELTKAAMRVEKQVARQAILSQSEQIQALILQSRNLAASRLTETRKAAINSITAFIDDETRRLHELGKSNPDITPRDIHALQEEKGTLVEAVDAATIKLDAIRLIAVGG